MALLPGSSCPGGFSHSLASISSSPVLLWAAFPSLQCAEPLQLHTTLHLPPCSIQTFPRWKQWALLQTPLNTTRTLLLALISPGFPGVSRIWSFHKIHKTAWIKVMCTPAMKKTSAFLYSARGYHFSVGGISQGLFPPQEGSRFLSFT